jgi:hypothetical protein
MNRVRVTIVAVETQQCILYVSTLSRKLHGFRGGGEKLLNIKLVFDFLSNFGVKHFLF